MSSGDSGLVMELVGISAARFAALAARAGGFRAYLIRLKHGTPAWKRATAKRLRDRQAGKFTWIEALEARLAKG